MKEREFDEQMRRTQIDKTRRERKAREAFKVRSFFLLPPFLPSFLCYSFVDVTVELTWTKYDLCYRIF